MNHSNPSGFLVLPGQQFNWDGINSFKELGLKRISWHTHKAKVPQLLSNQTVIMEIHFLGTVYYRLVNKQEEIDYIYQHYNSGNIVQILLWAPKDTVKIKFQHH